MRLIPRRSERCRKSLVWGKRPDTLVRRVNGNGTADSRLLKKRGEMAKKLKRCTAIVALVAAPAVFAAGPAAAARGGTPGSTKASWGEASWGEASWVEASWGEL